MQPRRWVRLCHAADLRVAGACGSARFGCTAVVNTDWFAWCGSGLTTWLQIRPRLSLSLFPFLFLFSLPPPPPRLPIPPSPGGRPLCHLHVSSPHTVISSPRQRRPDTDDSRAPPHTQHPRMLQYPVQLPPLSLSSNRDNDYFRSNDFNSINRRRIQKDSSRHHHLSISTNLSPSSDSSSPSTTSAKLPRSPYISSRALHSSSPVPFAHQALASPDIKSSSSSIGSQTLHDVLAPGDIVGEGFYLQDDVIRLVSHSEAPLSDSEPASEFEVIKQLGTGSYAVVYLVQEVLARPTVSDDGHMSTIGPMEFEGRSAISTSPAQTVYGRKYAIKCLSKANLDEDALAIQMSEVRSHAVKCASRILISLHTGYHSSVLASTPQHCCSPSHS